MQIGGMKPNAFRLIIVTMFGSAGMAAMTLRATGSILLAFLTYSVGGAALMALLAGIMIWRMGRKVAKTGASLEDWDRDKECERSNGSGVKDEATQDRHRDAS